MRTVHCERYSITQRSSKILQYHQRTLGLDGTRLVTLAMLDGFTFDDKGIWVDGASMPEWHEHLNAVLTKHDLFVFRKLDIAAVIDKVKQHTKIFVSLVCGEVFSVSDFVTHTEPNACGGFL